MSHDTFMLGYIRMVLVVSLFIVPNNQDFGII